MKNMHRPEEYTISVKHERDEGEWVYVARVDEIPDIVEFADTAEFARELAIDTISTAQNLCAEQGIPFPEPKTISSTSSGRITLRMAKSLQNRLVNQADREGVSLNSYIVTCLSSYSMERSVSHQISSVLLEIKEVANGMFNFNHGIQAMFWGAKRVNFRAREFANLDIIHGQDPVLDSNRMISEYGELDRISQWKSNDFTRECDA
ncbi:toxin-antitoxin system HicB family antitoxin [Yersinia enterocolitica]|nr:toxin-antitoxin system HicB family antitoxin [Yersinia enterocolitica]